MARGGRIEPRGSTRSLRVVDGQIPRFRAAAFEMEPNWEPHSSREGSLSYRDFEGLSLWTRAKLVGDVGKTKGDSEKHAKDMEGWLDAAGLNHEIVDVEPDEIEALLAQFHSPFDGTRHDFPAGRSFQVVGCRIGKTGRPLRLGNLRAPISLSFIGCIFEGGLILREASIASLDLSGSSFAQLDLSGLKVTGPLSLARSTILAPASLSGVRIGGDMDLSDLLAAPVGAYSPEVSVAPDRGMLDLSRAIVSNEVSFDRARIWGGLSWRGAEFKRSVFARGCTFVSPLGLLEQWASDVKKKGGGAALGAAPQAMQEGGLGSGGPSEVGERHGRTGRAERIAKGLHNLPEATSGQFGADQGGQDRRLSEIDARMNLEVLEGFTAWDVPPARGLIRHSERQLSHAIRADNVSLAGTLFLEQTFVSGVLRAKYARIGGSVRLGDAELHPASAIVVELAKGRDEEATRNCPSGVGLGALGVFLALPEEWRRALEREDRVIDLTQAVIDGDFSTEVGGHAPALPATGYEESARKSPGGVNEAKSNQASTLVSHGRLKLKGIRIGGSLILRGMESNWRPAIQSNLPPGNRENEEPLVSRTGGLDQSRIRTLLASGVHVARSHLEDVAIDLDQAKIGDDVDFRESENLWGVQLQNAKVGGSIYFSDKSSARPINSEPIETGKSNIAIVCHKRARGLGGRLNLRGCDVEGDVFLLFGPACGPQIKMEQATICGRLDIYPQARPDRSQGHAEGDEAAIAHVDPGMSSQIPADHEHHSFLEDHSQTHWHIDLRNARATVFSHAPEAWPIPGALSLDGFVYDAVGAIGPLAPLSLQDRELRFSKDVRNEEIRRNYILGSVFVATIAFIVADSGFTSFFSSLSALALLFWVLVPWVFGYLTDPKWGQNKPLALSYLARQRLEHTRYQNIVTDYVPLQPYDVATRAMREAGRYVSANIVEVDRLRRRVDMLSYRIHGATRPLLESVFAVSKFGFSTERLVRCFILPLVALTFSIAWAGREGQIERRPETVQAESVIPCGKIIPGFRLVDSCPGFPLALDLLAPVDLGQVQLWRAAGRYSGYVEAAQILVQIYSILFFLIVGTALVTRMEAVFSKGRE